MQCPHFILYLAWKAFDDPFVSQEGDGETEVGTDLGQAIGLVHRYLLGAPGKGGWKNDEPLELVQR